MENSRNPDTGHARSRERYAAFTLDPLSSVLTEVLRLTFDVPLYVAYSGGMDSHVLLHALARLRATSPWRVGAIHVDHGLRPESAQWARHCAMVCAALQVPYHSERVVVDTIPEHGLEDAARRARYAALRRQLPAGAILLTAHHQDDQAETLLLQLLRGAGPAGLAAMPPLANFGSGRIARPLLGFSRAALAAYAADNRLAWIDDASNRDTGPARNFLRHRVWPVLTERWPHAAERVALAARHQAVAATLLDELGRLDLATSGAGDGALRISALLSLSRERQANALRCWLRRHDVRAPSEPVLRQLLTAVGRAPQTQHAAVRWPGAEVRRHRDRLVLVPARMSPPPEWEATWEPNAVLPIPGTAWRLRARPSEGGGLACARIAGKTLRVRLRRGGERCVLRGHHRKVKKLLQEAGIPPWERGHWPLVYIDGDLAAIGDRWVCEPYAAAANEPGFTLVLERDASY